MNFQEYWATRPSIDYDEMVEAKAAFDFQQARMSAWRDAKNSLPESETQVIAIRSATKEQLSIDKEYCQLIFAAIDPDNKSAWYDWESGNYINTKYFNITHWMPVDDLMKTLNQLKNPI